MEFVYNDGGRSKYFKAKNVGDCVTRAIANATGRDYKEVYDALNALAKSTKNTHKGKKLKSSARDGMYKKVYHKYLTSIGWVRCVTCKVGEGVKMHLRAEELPKGNLIVEIARHLTNVRDGIIYDTYDCSDNGYTDKRAVYAYWTKG